MARQGSDDAGRTADPAEASWVSVAELSVGYTPRRVRLDEEHVLSLAEVMDRVPPIIIDEATLTVIDGAHRLEAARRAGMSSIRAVRFSGDALDAMVLAIQANISHGKPLSRPERMTAAAELLKRSPTYSDRRIAEVCGVSHTTVAAIRMATLTGHEATRTGRDGRKRPVQPSSGRSAVAELLGDETGRSLRQTARLAGVSPSTVRRVADRLTAGPTAEAGPLPPVVDDPAHAQDAPTGVEPAWWGRTAVSTDDLVERLRDVPLGRLYEVADDCRRRAQAWTAAADLLELRARQQQR